LGDFWPKNAFFPVPKMADQNWTKTSSGLKPGAWKKIAQPELV